MLVISYFIAAISMAGAAAYLYWRLGPYLTASTMLIGTLLLIYGPAYLVYMLTRGSFSAFFPSVIFEEIAKQPNFDAVKISLNLSIALLFVGVVAGTEIVNRLAPATEPQVAKAVESWDLEPLPRSSGDVEWPLLVTITILILYMASVSLHERHIGVMMDYMSHGATQAEKIAYRNQYGASGDYLFRVLMTSIAPMFVIWGTLEGLTRRWWPLLVATALLLILTLIAKAETLSKGPPALFLLQLLFAAFIVFRNDVTWRIALSSAVLATVIFYPVIVLTIPEVSGFGAVNFLYHRVLNVPSEALLEYFGAFPNRLSFMWGTNNRLVSELLGIPFEPAYLAVARTWRDGMGGTSSNAMFIADAWADFSYYGVLAVSIVAGVICRAIDFLWLARGKTVVGIAVLSAAFIGIYHILMSALNTACLSGGLVLAPVLAGLVVWVGRLFSKASPREQTVT